MFKLLTSLLLSLGLSACSTIPNGPSILVLPGTGKDYGQFHEDDLACRKTALAQLETAANAPDSRDEGQGRYDIDYVQCMYGHGHRVPIPEGIMYGTRNDWHPPPPPDLPPPASSSP